jgi:excisionase family DNA binding protein
MTKRLTAHQLAEVLAISTDTLYRMTRDGRIPCEKLSPRGRVRYVQEDVERALRQPAPPAPPRLTD